LFRLVGDKKMKMTDLNYVKSVKGSMHNVFDTVDGKEVIKFLELTCGWYHSIYMPQNPDMTLIRDGQRQVLATIKTFLELNADQIVELAKQKED
jgi:hypothetical protein